MKGNLSKILLLVCLCFIYKNHYSQSCNGFGGPLLSGNTVIDIAPICAPTTFDWEVTYFNVDDGGNQNNVSFEVIWGDNGTTSEIFPYDASALIPGSFDNLVHEIAPNRYKAELTHTYPDVSTACSYEVVVYLMVDGVRCTSTNQSLTISSWDTDDEGTGELLVEETSTGVQVYQLCAGETATINFTDNSTFNCNTADYPDYPNTQTRWIQFEYGTSNNGAYAANNRIPTIFVDPLGINLQVTDVGGNLINDLNGDGFTSPYRGTVVQLPGPVNASGEVSLDVFVPAGVSTAGEVFEITLRNWNYCNQYDDGVLPAPGDDGDNAPIEMTALIEIVTTPPDLSSVDKDICVGSAADITVPGTNVTWYDSDPDVDPLADTIHEGNTFDPIIGDLLWPTFTPIDTTVGGPKWTATYYVTQRITDCPSYSVPITIEINEVPQRPTIDITGSTSFCYDGATDVELAADYPNTASDPQVDSIQWFKDGVEVPGASGGNDSILYLDQVVQSGDYYVKIIGAPTSYCENQSDPVTIQIDTVPIDNSTNHNAEVCHNTTTDIELDADIVGTSFDWIITKGAGTGATAGSGIIGNHIIQTLTNLTNDPDTVIYQITPTGPGPTNCAGDAVDIEVVVHPIPDLLITNNNPDICSSTNCDIDFTSSVASVSFSWTVVAGAANGATANSGANINETLTNGTTSPVTVTYRVTPTGPAPPNCVGSFTDVDVVVYPIPDASSSLNNLTDICHNQSTDIDLDANVVGTTLDWVIINENGTGAIAGSGNIGDNIGQTLLNGGPGSVTVTYRITPTGPGATACVGSDVDRDVTVHPLPTPGISSDVGNTICDGDVVEFTGTGGTNYEFYVNALLAQSNSVDDTYDTDTLVDGDVVTVLVTDGNSCQATSVGITMTVHPIPVVDPTPAAQSICSGQNANISLASIPIGGTFAWKYYETAALGGTDGTGITILEPLINAGVSYESATYRIATTRNGCISDSLDVVVDVSPGAPDIKPIIDGETPVCQDTTMVLYEITNTDIKASTFIWNLNGLPNASFIGNTNNDTVYVEFIGQTASVGSIEVEILNGCSGPTETSDPFAITVNDLPTANDVAVTECSDATEGSTADVDLTVNEATINGGLVNYFYFTDAGLSAAVADETDHTITNGDIIYVLVQDGTCQDTAEISYTIDPKPEANDQTPTVCSDGTEGNTATVDLTTLNNAIDGTKGYTISFYTDPGLAIGDLIASPTNYLVTDTEVIYAKVENGGCEDTATITYTVNPRPTAIDQTPADICSDAANGNQAVVNLTSLENAIDDTYTYTINWFSDAALSAPIGTPNSYNATDGVAIYAQVVNGGCQDTATATYTINPTPNVTNADLTDEICTTVALNFTPTGDVGSTTFNWTSSVTGGTASGNTASSSGNITDALTNSTNIDAEVTYQITPTAAGCTGATVNFVVTVHPKPNVNNTDLQDSICSGGSVLYTPTGDVAATTFNWVSVESSGNVTDPGNGSSPPDISHNLANAGNIVENVTYTITPSANSCTGDPVNYVMYVNPEPSIGNTDLADSICSGEQLNFVPTGSVIGTNYNWTSIVSTGTITGNTVNSSGSITDVLNNTDVITSIVEYTITPVFNSCTGTPKDYEVTVFLFPDVNLAPLDAEICAGEDSSFRLSATGSDLSYQWQIFSNPNYSNLLNGGIYSGVTLNTLSLTNVDLSYNGNTYRIVVTNEDLCVDSSNTANLIVNALPTITSHPDTIDVCVNGNASFDIAPNSPADFNYQWQVDDDGDNIFDDLAGENAAILSISGITIAMDGYKYQCILDSIASGCQSVSNIALLNVNPLPTITDHPDNVVICEREDTAFAMLPNDELIYDYRWIVDRNDGNGLVNLASDANHADIDKARLQILNADIAMNGFIYRCVITNSLTSCRDTSDEAILTLKPLPVTSAISGRDNVCVGELAIAYQVAANPASTFTWIIPPEFTAAGGTINFGGGTNSPNHYVSLNYGLSPFTGELDVVETNDGCPGDTVSLALEAYEIPVPDAGNDTSICNGESVILGASPTATGGSGTYSYQWTPTTYLDNATAANPEATPPISLTYNLKVIDASSACESGVDQINITVNNVPTAPTSSNVAVCDGEAVPDLFAGGSNIKWYSDEFLNTLEYSGNPFVTGHTAVGVYEYWVTQTSDDCESPATYVTLTINSIPPNITAPDETICYGEPTPVLVSSGGTNPQWYADAALSSLVNIGITYNTGKFAVGIYTYYLTDKQNNCESEPDTVVLTINAVPSPPTSNDITVCQGEMVPDLEATGTDILWYDDAGATSLVHTGNVFPTGNSAPGTYNYYATQTIDGCESNVRSVKLTINPSPVITNIQYTNQTACESNDGTITLTANGTPPLTYSINDEATFLSNGYFSGLGTGTFPTSVKNYYGCVTRGDTIDIASGDVPPAPNAGTDAFYCFGDVIADISASAISGGSIVWFSDPGLTNQIGAGNTYSPSNTIGETKYYASELAGGCYSLPSAVTITIYSIPAMPVVFDTAVCDGNPIPSLEAIGENIKWYSDDILTVLSHIGNSFTTGHTAVGSYTYYATQTVNNCESDGNDATLTINTTPVVPVSDDVTICYGDPTPNLIATGNNIKWYDDVNLTSQIGTGSPYSTGISDVGIYYFYVTQTQGQCENDDEVILTINAIPGVPIVLDTAICDDETVPNLTAEGQNIRWYDDSGLTNLVGSGNSFNTGQTSNGTYNYYVTQTVNNCESDYEVSTLIINEKPDPPDAEDLTICFGDDAILTAIGYDIHWYSDDFGNPLVFNGNPFPTGETLVDEYNYFVSQVVNGCESNTKDIRMTINPVPLILGQSFVDQTACDSDDGQILVTAKETPPEGEAPVEYSIDAGVIFQNNGTFLGLKNGLYPIVVSNGFGCLTYGDTIEILDGGAPAAPVAGDDSIYCFGTPIADLYATTSSGGDLTWYDNPILTNVVGTGTSFSPNNSISELTYYVTETSGTCESSPTPVKITINSVPDKYNFLSDTSYCAGDIGVTLELDSSAYYIEYQLMKEGFVFEVEQFGTGLELTWEEILEGEYFVVATDTSSGCSSIMNDTVEVIEHPLPDASFNLDTTQGCSPLFVRFNRISEEEGTYTWDFGDGFTDNSTEDPSHTFVNESPLVEYFEVYLKAVTGNGCADSTAEFVTVYPLPDYDFAIIPDSACHPATVQFSTKPGAASYKWDFGNGLQSGDYTMSYAFNNYTGEDKTFPVELVAVSSGFGCVDTVNKDVVVHPEPMADFELDAYNGCTPFTVHITNNSSGNIKNYFWDYGDNTGADTTSATEFDYTYYNSQTYEAVFDMKLTVESEEGCITYASPRTIRVYPEVVANFIADTVGCSPLQVQFDNRSYGTDISSHWDFGDSQFTSTMNPVHEFVNTGTVNEYFTVQLVVRSNQYFCTDTMERTVEVFSSPLADFVFTPESPLLYPATTIYITDETSAGSWNYLWNFGDGNTSESSDLFNYEYVFDTSGVYWIQLHVSSENCWDTVSYKLEIHLPPPEVDISPSIGGCSPLEVQFINNTIYAEQFKWEFGDGSISYAHSPQKTYYETGIYLAKMTATGPGGEVESTPLQIEVFNIPFADFGVSPILVYLPRAEVQAINRSDNSDLYRWNFGNDSVSTLPNPKILYQEEGVYDITLWAMTNTEPQCIDSVTKSSAVTVEDPNDIKFMNAFMPGNADGQTGDLNVAEFFPVIKKGGIVDYNLQVFNRWGELVFESKDVNLGWNGKFMNNGRLMEQDVYVWKVYVKYDNGEYYHDAGDVTLLR
jgi:PKD repeat protein